MDYIVELSSKNVGFSTGSKIPILSRKYTFQNGTWITFVIAERKVPYRYDYIYSNTSEIFLQTAAYIGLFFFLIKLKEPKRKRITITVVIYLAVAGAYFALLLMHGQEIAERLIIPVEIGLCLILLIICSADKWAVSIFVMFTQFNLFLLISYLSDLCASDDSVLVYNIEYLIYRSVLFGALLFCVFKIVRPRFRRSIDVLGKEWNLIALLAFTFYVLKRYSIYYPRLYWYEEDYRWQLVASSYLVFFSVYWLIFSIDQCHCGKV